MSVLSRLASVEPGEGRTASLMLAHSFFMGLATVFFETAASALFLSRFGSASLPYVYVAAAGLNIAVGFAYTRLSARTPFARLMGGTLWLLAGSVVALRLGLTLTGADNVIHYDPWWNPAVQAQATDRAYRIGQDKPVFVHHLFVADPAGVIVGVISPIDVLRKLA